MKDYYKILGLKKNASEEEIRTRWIKLMQKFHPDQKTDGVVEDERAKEINEAYQVLKHPSTRLEYDLKNAYQQRKRKGYYLHRISIPIGILIIFVILGGIYFKKSQVPFLPKPVFSEKAGQIHLKNTDKIDEIIPKRQRFEEKHTPLNSALKSETSVKVDEKIPKEITKVVIKESKGVVPSLTETTSLTEEALSHKERVPVRNILEPEIPVSIEKDLPKEVSEVVIQGVRESEENKQPIQEAKVIPPIPLPQINQKDQITHKAPLAPAPFSPIVMEEEVRKFLANYIERYTKKDLDGFLSLFSSGAIQNQKDGIEKIRMIYNNFFHQSREIHYYLKDIKIDIYKNPVEVKTSYEVVQILKKGGEKVSKGQIQWTLIRDHGNLKIFSLDYEHQKSK